MLLFARAPQGSHGLAYFREVCVWRVLSGNAARLGPKQAIVATAHKIARTVYHLLKTGESYREESAEEYGHKRRERERNHLERRTRKLKLPALATSSPKFIDLMRHL